MPKHKPLVTAALICEHVLIEQDRVHSIIRMVDIFYLVIDPTAGPDAVGGLMLTAFLALKAGEVKGSYEITVRLRTPSGKHVDIPEKWPVVFVAPETGANLTLRFALPVREYGVYWFDVIWEREVLTSIPLKLVKGTKPVVSGETPG